MGVKGKRKDIDYKYQIFDYETNKCILTVKSLADIIYQADNKKPFLTPSGDYFHFKGRKAYVVCDLIDVWEIKIA
jgi:hypothetical protein